MEQIVRVTAFCLFPKDDKTLGGMDAWVLYTGDGYRLPGHLLKRWFEVCGHGGRSIPVFITGPDNTMLAEGGPYSLRTNADDFGAYLIEQGMPSGVILTDSSREPGTHNQAISLVAAVEKHGWRRVALFTSGFHSLRALLTTLVRIPRKMREELLIIPEPSYALDFITPNPELEGGFSAWDLVSQNMLSRLRNYQEQGFCASFADADSYLERHGLGDPMATGGLYARQWAMEM